MCIQEWVDFLTLSTSRTFPVRPNVLSILRTANLGSTVAPAVEVSAVFLITTVVPFLTFSMVNFARSSLMFSMVGRWRSLGIPPFSSYKNSTVCLAISVMPTKQHLKLQTTFNVHIVTTRFHRYKIFITVTDTRICIHKISKAYATQMKKCQLYMWFYDSSIQYIKTLEWALILWFLWIIMFPLYEIIKKTDPLNKLYQPSCKAPLICSSPSFLCASFLNLLLMTGNTFCSQAFTRRA